MTKETIDQFITDQDLARHLKTITGFIHNLNSPIMNISGRVELMQFKYPHLTVSEEILKQLNRINKIIKCLRYITDTEVNNEVSIIHLEEFFDNFIYYLTFNLEYKHKLDTQVDINSTINLKIVPRYLLNIMYEVFMHCIKNGNKGDTLLLESYGDDNRATICLTAQNNLFTEEELAKINESMDMTMSGPQISSDEDIIPGLVTAKLLAAGSGGKLSLQNVDGKRQYLIEFPGT